MCACPTSYFELRTRGERRLPRGVSARQRSNRFNVGVRLSSARTQSVLADTKLTLSVMSQANVSVHFAHARADTYAPIHNAAPTAYSSQVVEIAYG